MKLHKTLLSAAMLTLLPLAAASACSTANWDNTATTTAIAGDPLEGDGDITPRYSGACALKALPAGGSFVLHNMAGGEGVATPYRARVYVYTGSTGVSTVLSATDAVDGGGASILSVTYDAGAGAFQFTAPGVAPAAINGIVANKWYNVEINYQQGSPFQAFVRGAGTATEQTSTTGNTTTGTVRSVRIGKINAVAGTGSIIVDDFDSSRGATRIGGFLRGDADLNGSCSAGDVSRVISDFFLIEGASSGTLNAGPTDCDENGAISAGDASCVIAKFFEQENTDVPCGGA